MKITTLVENLVYQPGLVAEHGLSFFLDTGRRRILFDTGQSNAFISNARALGIDISKADALVISHGHYDHTGGLNAFLEENQVAPVYIKKEALEKKYNSSRNFIGTTSVPEAHKHRLKIIDEISELDEGVFIVPEIPVVHSTDTSFGYFYTGEGNDLTEDAFHDEVFMAVVNNDKVSVISSCSHRGITNMIEACLKLFDLPLNLITGGFHLKGVHAEHSGFVIDFLKQMQPEMIGICHCTGVEQLSKFSSAVGNGVFYNYTGKSIQI